MDPQTRGILRIGILGAVVLQTAPDAPWFDWVSRAGVVGTLGLVLWLLVAGKLRTEGESTRAIEAFERMADSCEQRVKERDARIGALEVELRECRQAEQQRGNEWRAIAEQAQIAAEQAKRLLESERARQADELTARRIRRGPS